MHPADTPAGTAIWDRVTLAAKIARFLQKYLATPLPLSVKNGEFIISQQIRKNEYIIMSSDPINFCEMFIKTGVKKRQI